MPQQIICGFNAVTALFRRRPNDVARLFFTAEAKYETGPYTAALAKLRRPYRLLSPEDMEKAAGTTHHGGIAAIAEERHIPFLDANDPPETKLLLVLDQIGNPHNLGAIVRSAAFFGVEALLLHETRDAAMPSDAAYRIAEGAFEYLTLYRTRDLARALQTLIPHYRLAAATLGPQATPFQTLPRDRPLALVLGHEEHGISPPVLSVCRREIRIEGAGPIQSLNVAQAAAILLQAFTTKLPPTRPAPP
jgi:RNA methyltransferase, TrmH family